MPANPYAGAQRAPDGKRGRGRERARIIREHVLGSQVAKDLRKRRIELGQRRRKPASAGASGERLKRMLASGIAAGIVFDGHDHHGIHDGVGALRGFESILKRTAAGGVAAIAQQDDHAPPVAMLKVLTGKMNGIEQRCAAFGLDGPQAVLHAPRVAPEIARA